MHYLTRQLIARLPLWMVEGLAEFYGNTRIINKIAYLGALSVTNAYILRNEKMLPVSTLFEIDASSPYYHEQNKTSIFYAESWVLTYYLITRDWKENKHRMNEFVQLLNKGVAPKEAAAQTIGDAKALDDALRSYMRISPAIVKIEPPKIDENGFRVRSLEDSEALAVRADFMAHDRHYSEAQQMLEQALQADPKLGIAYDGLSFLALQQSNFADAEKWSSQALALDPQNYRANYYYAWSLLNAGRTDEESLGKAETSLRAVTKANPEFVHAYDALAYVLTLEGGKEKLDEAYMMTLQAVTREPGNVQYRVRSVEVLERQRRAKDAVRVATLAVEMAHTPEERQAAAAALAGAQQFEESWEKIEAFRAGQAALGDKAGAGEILPAGGLRVTRAVNMSAQALLLTNTQGVDLNAYLTSEVMAKIQREWLAEMQKLKLTAPEKKATVIFEFAILKDGSIAEMKLKQATEEPELDDALHGAIQAAGPFAPLPAKFRGKQIALRIQFNYDPGPPVTSPDAASGKK
ncbi:MAG TPA: TonB C-terminal domain-containing protein [Candidatus Bathyarchaeia archaeon]|nr:TonB C-terminal domain-containing protein [Candidatus Bathyarchaeia archaeon]